MLISYEAKPICVREIARNWMFIQSLLTLKASRYLSSSSRRSLFGAVSTESSPSNFIVNLPALKASVADGGRVMLGIVRGLTKMKKNKIYCYFLITKSAFQTVHELWSKWIISKQDYENNCGDKIAITFSEVSSYSCKHMCI